MLTVEFTLPFSKIIGLKRCLIEFEKPMQINQLIRLLFEKYPKLNQDIEKEHIEVIYDRYFLFISNGKALKLDDWVYDRDVIYAVTPMLGG